jgi:SAM-dependent methyltransferase
MPDVVSGNITFQTRATCELCGSNPKTILLSRDFTDPAVWQFVESYYQGRIPKTILAEAKYELAKCTVCGFIWQTQILNDEGMQALYGEWISADDSLKKKKTADLSMYSAYARQVEIIPSLVGQKSPTQVTVLDYGMGWGYWCLMAKAFGLNIMGFELSAERAHFCRKHEIEVVEDLEKLEPRSIDFINAEQVFEHLPNPRETLESLVQSLVHGGVVRISVPDGRSVETKVKNPAWKAAKDASHPLEHVNSFTNRTLRRLGQLVGLQVIDQPFLLAGRRGVKSYIRGILGKYYQQYLGTSLYFRKPATSKQLHVDLAEWP